MKFSPLIQSCSTENFCFHAGDYSFGFNGKDKESEFNSGAYDFGARIHDARLGRWMSVDPKFKEFENLSVYNFASNNPIYYIDPDGQKFKVAGSLTATPLDGPNSGMSCYNIAVADVYSLIPNTPEGDKFKSSLQISESGEVTLLVAMTMDEILKINDPGIELLYNLITSEKNYVYEVAYNAVYETRDGEECTMNLDEPFKKRESDGKEISTNNQIANLSKERKLEVLPEEPTNQELDRYTSPVPVDDSVDGQLYIAPSTRYVRSMGIPEDKPRTSIVFHELWENYFRTDEGLDYGSTSTEQGAHDKAIAKENLLDKGDKRKSSTPGQGETKREL